jgi:hypothetical protein
MNSCDQLYIEVAVHLRVWIDRLRPDIECSYLGLQQRSCPLRLPNLGSLEPYCVLSGC